MTILLPIRWDQMASSAKIACGVDKPSVSHSRTMLKQEVNSEFKQLSIFDVA